MMHGFGIGGFGAFGLIGMLLNLVITVGLIAGLVLLVVWAVRRFAPTAQTGWPLAGEPHVELSPRDVLQRRYARGEITREQYQQMLADLS